MFGQLKMLVLSALLLLWLPPQTNAILHFAIENTRKNILKKNIKFDIDILRSTVNVTFYGPLRIYQVYFC